MRGVQRRVSGEVGGENGSEVKSNSGTSYSRCSCLPYCVHPLLKHRSLF